MITIATLPTSEEAHLVSSKLESEGIHCFVRNQFTANNPLYSYATGGVRVEIAENDLQAARAVLTPEGPAASPYLTGYRCPSCGSVKISYTRFSWQGLSLFPLFLSLLALGVPFVMCRPRLCCSECGHIWKKLAGQNAGKPEM